MRKMAFLGFSRYFPRRVIMRDATSSSLVFPVPLPANPPSSVSSSSTSVYNSSPSAFPSSALYDIPSEVTLQPLLSDIIEALMGWRSENQNQLYTLKDVSCAVKESLIKKEKKKRKWKYVMYTIAFCSFLAFFAASIASTIFALHWIKDQHVSDLNVHANAKDQNPLLVQEYYSYIPVESLASLDLNKIERMENLVLQWGNIHTKNEKKFYFKVLSAFKDSKSKSTTLHLSSGYKFVVNEEEAILYDEKNEEIGVLKLSSSKEEETKKTKKIDSNQNLIAEETNMSSSSLSSNSPLFLTNKNTDNEERNDKNEQTRRLGLKKKLIANEAMGGGRYPINSDAGPPQTPFDNYCRYGCGKMAVTFPYYYRPFFGYGYPLVGTESMFPQGYGGYPAAPLLAAQNSYSDAQMHQPHKAGDASHSKVAHWQQNAHKNSNTHGTKYQQDENYLHVSNPHELHPYGNLMP